MCPLEKTGKNVKLVSVAVTGGLGTGKSTVCSLFRDLGAYVVHADAIVHQLLSLDTPIGQQVLALLGPAVLVEGVLDRAAIARCVFSHPKRLRALEALLHPAVYQEIKRQYAIAEAEDRYPLFVAEVPLLFESHGASLFDYVLLVIAPEAMAKARWNRCYEKTQHVEEDQYAQRTARLGDVEKKREQADFIIENVSDLKNLTFQINNIFHLIGRRSPRRT